jgi:hypothetical protein
VDVQFFVKKDDAPQKLGLFKTLKAGRKTKALEDAQELCKFVVGPPFSSWFTNLEEQLKEGGRLSRKKTENDPRPKLQPKPP